MEFKSLIATVSVAVGVVGGYLGITPVSGPWETLTLRGTTMAVVENRAGDILAVVCDGRTRQPVVVFEPALGVENRTMLPVYLTFGTKADPDYFGDWDGNGRRLYKFNRAEVESIARRVSEVAEIQLEPKDMLPSRFGTEGFPAAYGAVVQQCRGRAV